MKPVIYFPGEAVGAIPIGSTIEKCNSEPGDANPDGTRGKVISSIATPESMKDEYPGIDFFYFVEWDGIPGVPVGITSKRVREVGAPRA